MENDIFDALWENSVRATHDGDDEEMYTMVVVAPAPPPRPSKRLRTTTVEGGEVSIFDPAPLPEFDTDTKRKQQGGPSAEDIELATYYGHILAEHRDLDIAKMRTLYRKPAVIAGASIHSVVDAAIVYMNEMLEQRLGQKEGVRRLIALAIAFVFYGEVTTRTVNTAKGRVSRVLLREVGKVRHQGPWGSSPKGSGRVKRQ
jgi:hypothetical protein